MEHVVKMPNPPQLVAGGRLEIHQVPVWQDNLVWLLVCTETGEAAAVDGPEAAPVLAYCVDHNIRLTTILNTHTHGDHIGINRGLAEMGILDKYTVVGCKHRRDEIPGLTHAVDEGDRILVGQVEGTVWLTEGHIDGHISFLFDDALFCGDTLFAAGCGYLFDGPPAKMYRSLTRLAALDEETWVFCAHEYTQDNLRFAWSVEPENNDLRERIIMVWDTRSSGRSVVPSTIGIEKRTNPFIRVSSPNILKRLATANTGTLEPAEVFARIRALKDSKAYRSIADDDLPI